MDGSWPPHLTLITTYFIESKSAFFSGQAGTFIGSKTVN